MAKFLTRSLRVDAHRTTHQKLLDTTMGCQLALPGDWIVTRDDGSEVAVPHADFCRLYDPIDDDGQLLLDASQPHQTLRDYIAANATGRAAERGRAA
jgi:hypothetical protein